MAVGDLNLSDSIKLAEARIGPQENALGKGLGQPFSDTNSGSRKIMLGIHREHALPLIHAEMPIIQTGYENEFGHNSSSFIKSDSEYEVVAKIPKFANLPYYHYWVILLDETKRALHVVERISYRHITEAYGYQFDNQFLDNLNCGDIIEKDKVVKKSTSFDNFNNRMDGVNLVTAYIGCDDTMEDGIKLSESAAKKFDAPLYKKVTVMINDNDTLLNLYGEDGNYRTFPNIGEHVKNGILCAIRRDKDEEKLFTQSCNSLKDIIMSDDKFTVQGTVVDINVYCNNPEKLKTSYYNTQLKYLYDDNIVFCNSLVRAVEPLLAGNKMTYDLQKLYYTCKNIIAEKPYIKDKSFSNIIMEIMVLEINHIGEGDKLSNRYGGKGVVSKIVPDHLMPRLEDGTVIDIQYNSSTVVNRENPGQLFETSATHIGNNLIDFITSNVLDEFDGVNLLYNYVKLFNPEQADSMFNHAQWISNPEDMADFVKSMCMDGGIVLSLRPVSDSIDIYKLRDIYKEFPWVNQSTIYVPITDSNGNVRYIKARRPIVAGKQYIYRLKQYAEEKFSVTSLSSTNFRNENSRSKANKVYKGLFTKTPIRFGEMETGDMAHLGMEVVIVNLMLHSASPQGRRLAEELLTGDPFNINIKLDESSKNRSVEILDVYLKTMGLKLTFEKVFKKLIQPILKKPILRCGPVLIKPISRVNPNEYFDPNYLDKLKEIDEPNGMRRAFLRQPILRM